MRKTMLTVLSVCTALAVTGGTAFASEMGPAIIGGTNATETYSFMVSLDNGCGGSLVAPEWIVTADHCGDASRGRIGSTKNNSGGEVRDIDSRITKPGTDLTLMHLTRASTKTPVRLAETQPEPGTTVRIIGFGSTRWPNPVYPTSLKQLDLRVIDSSECTYGASTDVCLEGDGAHSACHGDSGGPGVVGSRGDWVLVGETHSAGDDGPDCHTTSLYTGIAAHVDWIKKKIRP